MAVDLRSSGLLGSRHQEEDVDPMASVANVVDCMLVFACGLLMSLVLAWNVDIGAVTEIQQTEDMTEVSDPENLTDALTSSDGSSYIDMGTVYMDPTTGKYYMLQQNTTDESGSGSTDATTTDSGATDTATTSGATDTGATSGATGTETAQ